MFGLQIRYLEAIEGKDVPEATRRIMSSTVTNQVASSAFKPSILYMNSCVNFFHYVFISCLEHLGFNIYLRLINNMAYMITCLRLRALANKMFV